MQQHFPFSGYHEKIMILAKMEISACWQHCLYYKECHLKSVIFTNMTL